jgi:chromosomal replication initiator protein
MENQLQPVWNHVLDSLKSEVSEANFATLFKKSALLSLDDDIATIACENTFILGFIQKKYLSLIQKELEKNVGKPIEVLLIPKEAQSKKGKSIEDTPLFSQTTTPVVQKTIGHLPRVRPDFTFETMAVSPSNQLAFTAAQTVAKNIGHSYNPLFIYGPVGVGKTHLMQAIANHVYMGDPARKIIYITSEEFTNEVVEAIRGNQTSGLKRKFRTAYLLIIDDVQFIAGKDKVQEELFHTFNTLIDQGSQIVLSSDRPPSEIQKLEKRLSSRFSGGLTVDVEAPDFELKTAILLIKAKKYNVALPIEAAKVIADSVEDTRSLEGMLLRVITVAASQNEEITESLAKKALNKKDDPQKTHLHADDVITIICEYFQIKPTQIKGPKRDASLVKARQVAMYLLKHKLGLTLVEIGNILGGRDHTTVMHGVEKMEDLVDNKAEIREDILGITKRLYE